jgi:hypothetical protein
MPHKRLFQFIVTADINALPSSIQDAFSPDTTAISIAIPYFVG